MLGEGSGQDSAVQATNDDAVAAKHCAVKLGYWKDPYLQYFCRNVERRAPEMNRGYFARTMAIKTLVASVIELTKGKCQVVSLGAGFDTLFWRLKDEGLSVINYTEIDFSAVVARKCYSIKRTKFLMDSLHHPDTEVLITSTDLHSKNFHIVSADLRVLSEVQAKLKDAEIDPRLPTVFIAECVLVYIEIRSSEQLLKWIAESFPTSIFINYEQTNMNDRFGHVMIENLRERGCCLSGASVCSSLESQKQRFNSIGWSNAVAWDMTEVYQRLPQKEIQRIEKIEFLDERELMIQLFQHYCVALATKDSLGLGVSDITL